ncbi:PREDICTED: plasma serine protease inhibitor [Ceratotherium simum simum]|uniref:Plasma serine protease inhibitor n=1 Tax=Ceratotherium simum simum TaxID=73337 RepID=A0ABM0HUU2_CERSS|nr:PREDICTED: plasma serine protease inhibitor [Ceratotherium simum simum]
MQLNLLLCLVLLSPLVATLHRHRSRETKKKGKELPPVVTTVDPHTGDFAFDLYRALAAAAPNQNIFFSPLSISMTLAMISLGARSNTKAQILQGLGLNLQGGPEEELHSAFQQLLQELSRPKEGLQLSLGNALFINPTVHIQDTFLNAMRTLYLADTIPTNFGDPVGAQKQINDYVAKETKGKIADLVKDLDSTEIMVMVNYIFFKAKWETSFDHKSTQEQDFHVTSEMVVRVPMMRHEEQYYYLLDRNLSCRVVGIPYQGNATALFILPSEGRMGQVENGLNKKILRKWLKMFIKRQLELYLPKFSIEGSYQLEKVLPKLGISDVFTSHANLSGISNHSNIQVSEMVHKAVVEVDESGTKAAAATGAIFTFRSARMSPLRIVFNKPFLMLIVENMENILFLGKVTHP